MSKRTITKNILAAYDTTAEQRTYDAGTVTILAIFPQEAFMHAPRWSPGPSFSACIEYRSWMREHDKDHIEAVAVVHPRGGQPAWDGSPEWPGDEVWHVLLPRDSFPSIGDLYDKPHRVGWLGDPKYNDGGQILNRTALADHPLGAVHAWWDGFHDAYGFTPKLLELGEPLLESGRMWLSLSNLPAPSRGLSWLIEAAVWLHERFGAEIRVYPWDPARRDTTSPYRYATLMANPNLTLSADRYEGR